MKVSELATRFVRATLIAFGVVVVATVVLVVLFAFRCSDDPIAEVRSPNGALRLTVFEENCQGATGGIVTHINLGRSDREFRRTLINRTVHEGEVYAVIGGGYDLKLKWLDDSTVKISCSQCNPKEILEQNKTWKGVSIQFE